MGLAEWWYAFHTTRLSKPAEDRCLFRATRNRKITSVLEVGVGDLSRGLRLIDWLHRQNEFRGIRYAAIDLFEAGDGPALKEFHSLVSAAGAKPLPVPGALVTGFPRIAHTIGAVDLLILREDTDALSDPGIAAFVPRIVGADSVILATDADSGYLYELSADQLHDDLRSGISAAA